MALTSDLISVGILAKPAEALGDQFQTAEAAGTTAGDATAVDKSFILVQSASGADAGIIIPNYDQSPTKRHLILNTSGVRIRAYVSGTDVVIGVYGGITTGAPTYANIPNLGWGELILLYSGSWVAIG